MYQYFIQQIINKYNKSVVGYELLESVKFYV